MIGEVLYACTVKFDIFSFNRIYFYTLVFKLQSKYYLMYFIILVLRIALKSIWAILEMI